MAELTKEKFRPVDRSRFDSDAIVRPTVTYWQDAWRRLRKYPIAVFSMILLLACVLFITLGPTISGEEYVSINAVMKNKPADGTHWFGTDILGRDLFSRVCVGARASLIVAIACTFIQIVVGCAYGGIMAYFGGWLDEVMMRIVEILTSIPSLLLTLLIMMVLGQNMGALLVAMCLTSWCGTARQMRGMIMQLRESEYVMAAETLGANPSWIIRKHLIPNTLSILILNVATSIPSYIFTEASLSFLGMGLKEPVISLGVLISNGQSVLDLYPYQIFYPALVLCIIVLAFNLLGDGLRDALDPRLRQ